MELWLLVIILISNLLVLFEACRAPKQVVRAASRCEKEITKCTLIFGRTETDGVNLTWTGIKTVEIELPFENDISSWEQWQLIGAQWEGKE